MPERSDPPDRASERPDRFELELLDEFELEFEDEFELELEELFEDELELEFDELLDDEFELELLDEFDELLPVRMTGAPLEVIADCASPRRWSGEIGAASEAPTAKAARPAAIVVEKVLVFCMVLLLAACGPSLALGSNGRRDVLFRRPGLQRTEGCRLLRQRHRLRGLQRAEIGVQRVERGRGRVAGIVGRCGKGEGHVP